MILYQVNSKPEDLSLAIEFHISSWGKHNLVQLYAQFKDKITTHAENTNLKFGETELIPEHESLMVAYSSDPHVAAGDGKEVDTEVDEDDMTVMITIIAVVAGAFIALLVVAVVVFAVSIFSTPAVPCKVALTNQTVSDFTHLLVQPFEQPKNPNLSSASIFMHLSY